MEKTLTTGGSSIPGLRGASSQLKKRKRLNAVLDKISHRSNADNNNGKSVMFGGPEQDVSASQKRELWRDNPQKNVVVDECSAESSNSPTKSTRGTTKAKSLTLTISNSSKKLVIDSSGGSESLEDFESDAAASPRKSPLSSPQVSLDSPRICFSPLRIKDSIEEEEAEIGTLPSSVSSFNVPKFSIRGCESLDSETLIKQAHPRTPSSSSSQFNSKYIRSISPNPSLQTLSHLPSYLTEIYRRRCLSDTDLSATLEDLIKAKAQQRKLNTNTPPRFLSGSHHLSLPIKQGSSLESDSQESPLDLSIRSNVSSTTGLSLKSISSSSVESIPKSSSATKLAPNLRSSLEIVETSGNPDISYSCPICGQMFSLHDRLAKHMASRHKSSRSNEGSNTKAYACEVCKRSFARSDMLTRHMRLHTGIKPYTCRICGQVFSRSDHLSTHQRTHTGEKPYRCPTCPYAACRRDMITRHMRTHTRYELNESTSVEESSSLSDSLKSSSRSISCESDWNADSKEEPTNKPPSPMDTTDKQTHYNVDKSRGKR